MKHITRSCAVLLAAVLTVLCMAVALPALKAEAAAQPSFWIEVDNASPYTGDIVTVTFYVTNNDPAAITAFNGKIIYNSNFFSYYRVVPMNTTNNKVICNDENVTGSTVGFTFSDAGETFLRPGSSEVAFLSVEFIAVNKRSNTVNFSAAINACTVGNEKVSAVVQSVPVSVRTTAAPTTTTTAVIPTTTTTLPKVLSAECRLQDISIAPGTLNPAFNPEFVAYTVDVPNEVATIRISATPQSPTALVTGTGVKDLVYGLNSFTITVTAQDGTKWYYGIIVNRSSQPSALPVVTPGDVPSVTDPPPVVMPEEITPTDTTETKPHGTAVISESSVFSLEDNAVKIIGAVFGLVALFFFGFLSGFFIDKNIKRKRELERAMLDPGGVGQNIDELHDDFAQMIDGYNDEFGMYLPPEDDYYN